jgi:hypothetical protein
METLLTSINSGQRMRWTSFGTLVSATISGITSITNTALNVKGMTIYSSFWHRNSYHVDGVLHTWLSGILDITMLNALARFCHQPVSKLQVDEYTREHWYAIEPNNRFGVPAEHEVWRQDDPPPYEEYKNLTIYDGRHTELLLEIRKQERGNRPGYKAMPSQLSFGLTKR